MKMRKFGKLNIYGSAFGLGCMRFPTIEQNGKNVVDQELATSIIRTAIDGGVNYVDTAYVYSEGKNESVVGKALQDGYREKVMLATKLPVWDCKTKDDFYRLFNEQLTALSTDYIDFYLVHSLNKNAWAKVVDLGICDFLDDLKKQGKIKYAAFSFHDNYEAFEEILNSYDWDMCQIQFNLMDINNQAGLKGLKLAGSKNIPVVIMEGLLGGKLAKAPENVQKIYDSYPVKRSPAEWAFRWLCNFEEVATVLSGVTDLQQTKDNLRIFDSVEINSMSREELELIDKVREAYLSRTKVNCTGCRYCMPCPSGVDIPRIFEIWNDAFQYDKNLKGNYQYKQLEDKGNDSTKCVECGHCVEVCPQHIDIPEQLKKAAKDMA